MPNDTHTTQIIVRELHEIKSGRTQKGDPFTLWQVVATKPSGEPIAQNLRTFEQFPLNQPVEVQVEKFEASSGTVSYTVKSKGKSGDLRESVDELRQRVDKLEDIISNTLNIDVRSGTQRGGTPPPPPPGGQAPPPAAPAAESGGPYPPF